MANDLRHLTLVTVASAQKPQGALPKVGIDTTWNPPTGGTTWAVHSPTF